MYAKTLASLFLLLSTGTAVVSGENRLYLTGATFTLLVLYNKISEADAALKQMTKRLMLGRRRQNRGDDKRDSELVVHDTHEVTREVKRAMKSIRSPYHVYYLLCYNHVAIEDDVRESRTPGMDAGEKAIMDVLTWRTPAPQEPSPLDEFLPVGGTVSFYSTTSASEVSVTRLPRVDGSSRTWSVYLPSLGEMTLQPTALFESEALDKELVNTYFYRLVHSTSLPSPLDKPTPIEAQKSLGLFVPLDMLTVSGKYVVSKPRLPGVVLYDMFRLHTPMECGMDVLLQLMEEHKSDTKRKATIYLGRVSLSLQVLAILSQLRKAGTVPPPLALRSFVVNDVGKVLLADFSRLLKEDQYYILRQDGTLASANSKKTRKRGFLRLNDGGEGEIPYQVDVTRVDSDAARILHSIWCLSGVRADQSDESERSSLAAPWERSSSGSEEEATSRAPDDWSGCGEVPEEVRNIVMGLLSSDGVQLADITSHREYKFLKRFARQQSN